MARAIWSGSITFGLVSIPIKLFNAVTRKSVSFNQIDARTGARIRQLKVSALDGEEVPGDQIVRGYAISKDNYVTVSDDELAAIMPAAQRSIDIDEFVELADIDPVFYDSAYYLVPEKAAVKPYALLARAMEDAQMVAIGRFVMRSKQYVAAIRPKDGKLLLSTMVYADEVNAVDEFDELEAVDQVELSDRELAMARQLIDSLSAEFQPEQYRDTYREQVLEVIDRKAAGETEVVLAPAAAPDRTVVDLLAALEASVAEAKAARSRHPAARPADTADADDADEAAEAEAAGASGGGRKPARPKRASRAKAAEAKPAPKRKTA